MASALGLIRVVSNSEMVRSEEAQEQARQEAERNNMRQELQGLAAHVMECWEDARRAKNSVLPRLQKAQRARIGEYDPVKLQSIKKFGGSEEYARITANKVRVVEAWLRDVFLGQTEKPWTLNPTPKPDFPPDIEQAVRSQISMEVAAVFAQTGQVPDQSTVRAAMAEQLEAVEERLREEARKATARMERKMEDQLIEGGFVHAMGQFLADLATYPAAIMKGPILRRRKKLTWSAADGGDVKPLVEDMIVPEFERVDPFRAYPAAGISSPQEGYFIEHQTFAYQELYELIGAPGFDEEAIRAVLKECDHGGLGDWLGLVTEREDSDPNAQSRELRRKVLSIDALEFHGPVKGRDLIAWGTEDVEDPDATYEACVWLIGRWVIKAQLNYNPLGMRPYYRTSYEELPGEFWGFGIPDVLEDVQGIVNAAVRSLVNNMGMGSGPQVALNVDRLAPGEDVTTVHPWKIWQYRDSEYASSAPAVDFFQPQTNVNELISVIEKFYQFADDFSLVPRYMAGSDKVGGAGRTASGLSMLMDAANKGLKGVVSNVDLNVIKLLLENLYAHNMMYEQDGTLKGDAQVVARGAVSLMQLETLQLRRNEFLNVTANPLDSEIIGRSGRAEVLREVARGLELDVTKIVPSREQIAAMEEQMALPAPGQQSKVGGGEQLMNGAAVTDNFSPNAMTP